MRRLLVQLVVAVAAVGFTAYATVLLTRALAAGPLIETARAVETARTLPTVSPHGRDVLERALRASVTCSELIARARLTTSFFLLRRAMLDEPDGAARVHAFQRAYADVLSGLRCSPYDGKLWAVAASLESSTGDIDPVRYRDLMLLSVRTSPFEQGALDARWSSLAISPDLGELLRNDVLARDLTVAVAQASPATTVGLISRLLAQGRCTTVLLPLASISRERARELHESAGATGADDVTRLVAAITPSTIAAPRGWRAARLATTLKPREHRAPCES